MQQPLDKSIQNKEGLINLFFLTFSPFNQSDYLSGVLKSYCFLSPCKHVFLQTSMTFNTPLTCHWPLCKPERKRGSFKNCTYYKKNILKIADYFWNYSSQQCAWLIVMLMDNSKREWYRTWPQEGWSRDLQKSALSKQWEHW